MGYIRHDAIVVTSFQTDGIDAARNKAWSLNLSTSEVLTSPINQYFTFLIAPDGSKEGWEESDAGDSQRAEWVAWAKNSGYYLDWVHINYGGDDDETVFIKSHSGVDSPNGEKG